MISEFKNKGGINLSRVYTLYFVDKNTLEQKEIICTLSLNKIKRCIVANIKKGIFEYNVGSQKTIKEQIALFKSDINRSQHSTINSKLQNGYYTYIEY